MQGEMTDRLLNIQSAYLEAYLVQTAQSQPENITAANMLWKYYEKVIFIISLTSFLMTIRLCESNSSEAIEDIDPNSFGGHS